MTEETMENIKYAYIHSLKLADILVNKGFKCLGKKVNVRNPKFSDFIFEESEQLRKVVDEYTAERHT